VAALAGACPVRQTPNLLRRFEITLTGIFFSRRTVQVPISIREDCTAGAGLPSCLLRGLVAFAPRGYPI
jgi:hypothetical protein